MDSNSRIQARVTYDPAPDVGAGIPVFLDDEEPTVAIKNETIEEIGLEQQRQRRRREEAERRQYETMDLED